MDNQDYRRKKDDDEIASAFQRQIRHLRRSAKAFDEGDTEEAERLASAIYILCHEGTQNRSLLKKLKIRTRITYYDSSAKQKDETIIIGGPPLLMFKIDEDGGRVGASCAENYMGEWVSFNKWWAGEVFHNVGGFTLTRKTLVFFMRSQDGGAHVDSHVRSGSYDRFVQVADQTGYFNGTKTSWMTMDHIGTRDAHWQTMRQIAWELEHSLEHHGFLSF